MDLLDFLISEGRIKTPAIINAFAKIKRSDFVPQEFKAVSGFDEALPIGQGQTISQPSTVAFMLEILQPKEGDNVLDVGSGSGWTTALLCDIVGKKGKVFAFEIVPEIYEFGKINIDKYGFIKNGIAGCFLGDAKQVKIEQMYDKILVSAAGQNRLSVQPIKEKLKVGGRMVCPIKNSIWLFIKKENEFLEKEYPGFVFVPLI